MVKAQSLSHLGLNQTFLPNAEGIAVDQVLLRF